MEDIAVLLISVFLSACTVYVLYSIVRMSDDIHWLRKYFEKKK